MRAFISYQDGNKTVEGSFELINKTDSYVEIESDRNTIIIPYHRINKIKLTKEVKK
jgi:uncharacterized protein (UPF0248 family)